MSANDIQVGGNHYKQFKYETWDVILDWKLGYLDGNAVKYLSRWKDKGGVNDLFKAKHYIEKLIEEENKKTMQLEAYKTDPQIKSLEHFDYNQANDYKFYHISTNPKP